MLNKILISMLLVVSSCAISHKRDFYKKIYEGLIKDRVYEKFIGYHIVRRDAEQFFYKDLSHDSSDWQTVAFNNTSKNIKQQFEIMKKYNIKAVITENYNSLTKKLEYRENSGYDFNEYELTFMLADSIKIVKINFDIEDYNRLIKDHYFVVENLDSTWLVLKTF